VTNPYQHVTRDTIKEGQEDLKRQKIRDTQLETSIKQYCEEIIKLSETEMKTKLQMAFDKIELVQTEAQRDIKTVKDSIEQLQTTTAEAITNFQAINKTSLDTMNNNQSHILALLMGKENRNEQPQYTKNSSNVNRENSSIAMAPTYFNTTSSTNRFTPTRTATPLGINLSRSIQNELAAERQ
jgi:hypothetical protein